MLRFLLSTAWLPTASLLTSERKCSALSGFATSFRPVANSVNGNAPFFEAILADFGDFERICSVL